MPDNDLDLALETVEARAATEERSLLGKALDAITAMAKGKPAAKDKDPEEDEDDGGAEEDEGQASLFDGDGDMEKGTCPRCHHSAPGEEFGIMVKGARGLVTNDVMLYAMIESAVEAVASEVGVLSKGTSEGLGGVAEILAGLKASIDDIGSRMSALEKGQEDLAKGAVFAPRAPAAKTDMDKLLDKVAGERGPTVGADGEDLSKGRGGEPPPLVRLTRKEAAAAHRLGLLSEQEFMASESRGLPPGQVESIKRQIAADAA